MSSTFSVDSEVVNDAVETLRDLLNDCENMYLLVLPESTEDQGKTHDELYQLCQEVRDTCWRVGELINNSILFLGETSEMFDRSDKESAAAVLDS